MVNKYGGGRPLKDRFLSTRKDRPCPVCGKTNGKCSIREDYGLVICSYHASNFSPKNRSKGFLHLPPNGTKFSSEGGNFAPVIPLVRLAPIEVRNKVYSIILDTLKLSETHRKELLERGMSPDEIQARGYKSLRGINEKDIVQAINKNLSLDERKYCERGAVPGFYSKSGKLRFRRFEGMLIPALDAEGNIQAIKIRPNKIKDDLKYFWLSSSAYGGASIGSPCHTARPIDGDIRDHKIYLTEGELKADIAAERLKTIVISVPGVTQWESGGLIGILKGLNASQVVVAYDMDSQEKEEVKKATENLIRGILASNFNEVFQAKWELAQGKGIDDLLVAGESFRIEKCYKEDYFKVGQIITLDPKAIPNIPTPTDTLETARKKHSVSFDELIQNHETGQYIFTSGTGSGKTHAVLNSVVEALRGDNWPSLPCKKKNPITGKMEDSSRPLKVGYMTDTKETYIQSIDTFKEFQALQKRGDMAILEGRSNDPESAYHCFEAEECQRHGQSRHIAMIDVCQPDQKGLACQWIEKIRGESYNPNALCPYLESMKRIEQAKFVMTTKPSLLNGSKLLDSFDIVIIDEGLIDALTESFTLTTEQINHYQTHATELSYPEASPFWKLFELLRRCLTSFVESGGEADFMPVLKSQAKEMNIDIPAFMQSLKAARMDSKQKRFDFEKTFIPKNAKGKVYPLRSLHDLFDRIEKELDRPEGADTQLILTLKGLRIILLREEMIEILKSKTVIILDATPSPLIKELFPEMKEINHTVPEYTQVTQYIDGIYAKGALLKENALALRRIEQVIEKEIREKEFRNPVIITYKSLNPDIKGNKVTFQLREIEKSKKKSPIIIRYGHFDRDNKGLNKFQDCDAIFIVGHYMHPLNGLRALTRAVRDSGEAAPNGTGEGGKSIRPYYAFRDQRGEGKARICHQDQDALLNSVYRHSEESPIIQAIGRGRAAFRKSGNPLKVFLFGAMPVPGVKVDHITTVRETLGITRKAEALRIRNRKLLEEYDAKIYNFVFNTIKNHEPFPKTVVEFSKQSGISKSTLERRRVSRGGLEYIAEKISTEAGRFEFLDWLQDNANTPSASPLRYNIYIPNADAPIPFELSPDGREKSEDTPNLSPLLEVSEAEAGGAVVKDEEKVSISKESCCINPQLEQVKSQHGLIKKLVFQKTEELSAMYPGDEDRIVHELKKFEADLVQKIKANQVKEGRVPIKRAIIEIQSRKSS